MFKYLQNALVMGMRGAFVQLCSSTSMKGSYRRRWMKQMDSLSQFQFEHVFMRWTAGGWALLIMYKKMGFFCFLPCFNSEVKVKNWRFFHSPVTAVPGWAFLGRLAGFTSRQRARSSFMRRGFGNRVAPHIKGRRMRWFGLLVRMAFSAGVSSMCYWDEDRGQTLDQLLGPCLLSDLEAFWWTTWRRWRNRRSCDGFCWERWLMKPHKYIFTCLIGFVLNCTKGQQSYWTSRGSWVPRQQMSLQSSEHAVLKQVCSFSPMWGKRPEWHSVFVQPETVINVRWPSMWWHMRATQNLNVSAQFSVKGIHKRSAETANVKKMFFCYSAILISEFLSRAVFYKDSDSAAHNTTL